MALKKITFASSVIDLVVASSGGKEQASAVGPIKTAFSRNPNPADLAGGGKSSLSQGTVVIDSIPSSHLAAKPERGKDFWPC